MSKGEAIYGRRAVLEALRANRRVLHRLLIAEGTAERGALQKVLEGATSRGISVRRVRRGELEEYGYNHQGIVALADSYPYASVNDILERSAHRHEPPFVLLLDLLQDPQNLGSLLRTAEAVGVHGVLMAKRRAVGVTPSVVASSAGACEHLLIARGNLVQAMTRLKGLGAWLVGLEPGSQAQPIDGVDLGGPLGLVVGSEGHGLRRLVRESCDFLAFIPMLGKVESLNAAVAGSIALYLARRARNEAPEGLSEGVDLAVH